MVTGLLFFECELSREECAERTGCKVLPSEDQVAYRYCKVKKLLLSLSSIKRHHMVRNRNEMIVL